MQVLRFIRWRRMRSWFSTGVLILMLGGLAAALPVVAAPTRPNIIYLVMEDASREDFGSYGAHIPTPHIDALAAQGLQFSNVWVASTNCSPSRGAFLTGQYAHRNGLIGLSNQGFSLSLEQRTIVDDLRDAGYETVSCGKQHERRPPRGVAIDPREKRALHGFDRVLCENRLEMKQANRRPYGITNLVDQTIAYLSDRGEDAAPFFLHLSPHEAHAKWDTAESIYAQPPLGKIVLPPYLPQVDWLKVNYQQFLGAVQHADREIGRLLAFLDQQGLDENTVFVFTTDHGSGFRRAKGTLYEAGVGVPLIVRWKGVIAAGRITDALVSNIDLRPTFVEIAGGKPPLDVDGRSIRGLLDGAAFVPRKVLFAEHNFHAAFRPMRAVRDARYKLIVNFNQEPDRLSAKELESAKNWSDLTVRHSKQRSMPYYELYDLKADPHETQNLQDREDMLKIRDRLRDELFAWMEETNDFMKGAVSKVYWPKKAPGYLGQ